MRLMHFGAMPTLFCLTLLFGCGKKDTTGATGSGGNAPNVPAKNEPESKSIEGTYLITGIDFNGEKMPDEDFKKEPESERTVTIKGNKFFGSMGAGSKEEEFKIDNTKTPAQIDFTSTLPGGKTRTQFGIYKLEGDTLTIAVNNDPQQPPKDRPKDFKSNKESFIMTLKRK
jgi:uncharacterized protein (TIGR03067 family)